MKLIKLIQDFINEEYKFNAQQVIDAFKMAAKRELYLDGKRIDPSTFGQHLSMNVVGQILTAYKESKQADRTRPAGYNPKQLPEYQKKPITPAEAWELILTWTKEDGYLPPFAPYIIAYRYLVESGAIKPVPKVVKSVSTRKAKVSDYVSTPEQQAVEKYLTANVLNK